MTSVSVHRRLASIVCALAIVLGGATRSAQAQTPPAQPKAPAAAQPAPGSGGAETPMLKKEELEQLLAPIALYPDSLLAQMFMAATYPLEIVQADRWVKENAKLKDAALTSALEKQPWDASVKSLVNFPQVLTMMSEKLDMTIKLGDAFIAQQADVMATVQVLRAKAQAEGQLKSNEQQKIVVEAAPPQSTTTTVVVQQAPAQVIKIEPTQPEVIYVPSYSPTVVYGGWPYPSYPPYPYYPPGYVASNVVSFGVGMAVGAAWGYAWGGCNWGHGNVDIDIDRNTNINTNIDRSKAKAEFNNRQTNREGGRASGQSSGRGSFQHDPKHRDGVPYRDQKSAQRYGANQSQQATQAREAYRGRAEAGRQDIARGGASDYRGNNPSARTGAGTGAGQNRAGAAGGAGGGSYRPGGDGGGQNRPAASPSQGAANRQPSGSSGARGSSFDGVDRGGSSARAASQRGQSSRSGSASSGSRGGGGGSRGGGGGGGRGGGGGGGRGRSDVNIKSDFLAVDPQTVLDKVAALPITTWVYKDEPSARHIGPTAQDFYTAFGLGADDITIGYLDEGGVALSAIQALNHRLAERDAKIQAMERELSELRAAVQELMNQSARPTAPAGR